MRIVEQDDFIADCKTPMFLFWLESFLSFSVSGELPKAKFEKFAEHEFRGRRWMWVDPMKDIAASEICVKRGWKTNTQVAADLGTDYEDNLEGLKREQQKSAGVLAADKPAGGTVPPPMDGDDKEQDDEDASK
jgi:capsid protein